jgi:hypothetical protein
MHAWVGRGGAVTHHSQLNEGAPPFPALRLARLDLGGDVVECRPYSTPDDTSMRPVSTRLGETTLVTKRPVPLDDS